MYCYKLFLLYLFIRIANAILKAKDTLKIPLISESSSQDEKMRFIKLTGKLKTLVGF